MKYTALKLSSGKDYTKSGFPSVKRAKQYIEDHICNSCLNEIRRGGTRYIDQDGYVQYDIVEDVLGTSCGAEWDILTDKEFKELLR